MTEHGARIPDVLDDPLRNRGVTFTQAEREALGDHLAALLPIVYDPTVGEAIENYSHEYRRPRGIFLSIDRPDDIEKAFGQIAVGKPCRTPCGSRSTPDSAS